MNIRSFVPQSNLMNQVEKISIFPLHKWKNWGPGKWSHSPKFTWYITDSATAKIVMPVSFLRVRNNFSYTRIYSLLLYYFIESNFYSWRLSFIWGNSSLSRVGPVQGWLDHRDLTLGSSQEGLGLQPKWLSSTFFLLSCCSCWKARFPFYIKSFWLGDT